VVVGGIKIEPGDLLHGDMHGVLTVPLEIAHQVAAAAEKIAQDEDRIVTLCRSGGFTVEKLRDAVKDWK
jgi:regulator of RNase E activity RraA